MLTKAEKMRLGKMQKACIDRKTSRYFTNAKPADLEELARLIAKRDATTIEGNTFANNATGGKRDANDKRKTGPEKLLDSMNRIIDSPESVIVRTSEGKLIPPERIKAISVLPSRVQPFVDQGCEYIGADKLGILYVKDEQAVYSINREQGKDVLYKLSNIGLWSPQDFENLLAV